MYTCVSFKLYYYFIIQKCRQVWVVLSEIRPAKGFRLLVLSYSGKSFVSSQGISTPLIKLNSNLSFKIFFTWIFFFYCINFPLQHFSLSIWTWALHVCLTTLPFLTKETLGSQFLPWSNRSHYSKFNYLRFSILLTMNEN